MKKSIYYLVANTISIIAAIIFLTCLKGNSYPFFDLSLKVTSISPDTFEPIKYVLLVEAASIMGCAYECTTGKSNKAIDIIGAIVTILTVLYTWVSVVLVLDNYGGAGATIALPFFLIGGFALCVVSFFLSNPISKKNNLVGSLLPVAGVLLFIAGLVLDCCL